MEFKGLLWAAALISAARIFTLFLPTQALPSWGEVSRAESQANQPYDSFPSTGLPSPSDAEGQNPVGQEFQAQAPATNCLTAGVAVVTVYAGREIGSGSIVSRDGLVLTNNHVISRLRGRSLYVTTLEGIRYDGQIVATDRRNDLALLQLQTQAILPIVRLASTPSTEMGQPVCAIGSPFGQAGVVTEGRLLNIRSNGDLESTVLLKPGNSGGPLLNPRGEMIGVNKGVAKKSETGEGDRKSFATSITAVKEFIQQNRSSPLLVESKN
jgi:S1-C subfamily serine protease